jgi:serine/threonine protein kinase
MLQTEPIDFSTAPAAPQPGPFGRFYLQELINRGGMAEIWLATDQQNRPYALRRMQKTGVFDFASKKRFLRGCEIHSKIHHHELIIGYIEHGKIDGTPYLLMDYVEGENLKVLQNLADESLSDHVGNILIDMAMALEHMHDCGFMHLDFKPENVMISRNVNVRLIDFDLAQPIPKGNLKLSKMPGTPSYMAPEQLRKEGIDHRVDIFAFGVTAYELLTGVKPFPGETPDEVLRQQLDMHFLRPPRDVNPQIPLALERTILKCLERDPNKRHPIMSTLVLELKSALYV